MKTFCIYEGDLFVKRHASYSDMEGTSIILVFAMERIVGRVTSSRRVRGSLHASLGDMQVSPNHSEAFVVRVRGAQIV